MPILKLDDTELSYLDTGPVPAGDTLVFSHGLLMNRELFAAQIAALRGRHRCVAYDHRGQGASAPSNLRSIDMGTLTGDAAQLIEKLELGKVHFIGLSMGGFVGLRLAARRPELVKTLMLLDTSAGPEPAENIPKFTAMNLTARFLGSALLVDRILPIMFGKTFLEDPAKADVRRQWRDHLSKLPRSLWRAVNGVLERDSVEPELAQIRCPTLILVGDEDVATPPPKSERIQSGIAGSKLVVIPRAGHSSSIEQPEAVTREISAFLADAAARA
ncbi:MAG: alpha/beta fold hydrolase [Myxococcales bacterium]|nr:alpha/beta fold hydrolase [Myxococcales bacterium]